MIKELSWDQDNLYIVWNEKPEGKLRLDWLRRRCPCATCRGGDFGPIGANTTHIRKAKISSINFVGNYAINPHWQDGHTSGIHSYESLQKEMEWEKSGKSEATITAMINYLRGF